MTIPQKLQEMDVVLRRDGTVCWVLKDEIVGRLGLFGLDMLGYHLLKNYNYDFTYGKDLILEDLDEKERENIRKYDIIAVSGLDSTHNKLWVARNYEKSLLAGDTDSKNIWFRQFKWVFTEACNT